MSGVLLDTHVVLWLLADHPSLGERSRSRILSEPAWVSAAAMWEVSIKQSAGKLALDGDVTAACAEAGLRQLAVTWAHAAAYGEVELEHRDPFDRMHVAQAAVEGLSLLTADRKILDAGLAGVLDARA